MIKYQHAPDIEERALKIAESLELRRDFSRIRFVRSTGSQSRRTLARCHAFPRVLQAALGMKAHYIIEVISEKFDRLDKDEQNKTIIHELLHIPQSMKGGFRHHDFVCDKNIEKLHKELKKQWN
jgi:predicted metallopeptidase